jgi:oligopeptide/dipeptide ABC transporter ATP-binding protein
MTEPRGGALLELQNVTTTFHFGERTLVAVNNVSMQIREQEIVGIVGESGCGKSMTAFSILGIVPHPGRVESGHIIFNGKDLLSMRYRNMRRLRGSAISLVYQDPLSSLNPSFPVLWHFGEVLRAHGKRTSPRQTARIAVESLQKVKIPSPEDKIHQYPHQLSGGMRQRIVIALSLLLKPRIIIADEPTTALDVTTQKEIFNLIEWLKQEFSISFIVISHDLNLLGERCDRIYVMYSGQVVEAGSSEEIFQHPLHPYTQGLINSVPRLDSREENLSIIRGEVQNLMELPHGCFFQKRCDFVEQKCISTLQELRAVENQREVRCWKAK